MITFWLFIILMVNQPFCAQVILAFGKDAGLPTITRVCGTCHGLTINRHCIAGDCTSGYSHEITRQPWDMVISWMKAMGCKMTQAEQSTISRYLMDHFGKHYPIEWEQAGTASEGWNVVSFGVFRDRLYAGIEGSGGIFRLDDSIGVSGQVWKRVLETPNYTIYGLTRFQDKLFAGTNDPNAEIWNSSNGDQWQLNARLPDEKGITSLGLFQGAIYAGTTRATLYRSSDGIGWTKVHEFLPNADSVFPNWIRFILPFEDALYVGTEKAGIYRTTNGTIWTPVWPNEVTLGSQIGRLGARGAAVFNDTLYIGTTSGGEIWATGSKIGPHPIQVFSASPYSTQGYVGSIVVFGNFLYVGVGGTVFRTQDGSHWNEIGRLGPFTIEAMAGFNDHLYAGTALPPKAWIYRTTGLTLPAVPPSTPRGKIP